MRTLLQTLLCWVALSVSTWAQVNVLFVLMDDIGVDKVGAYGETVNVPTTPTLDSLAEYGLRCDGAYASQTCSPTRVGLMTGNYPHRYGVGTPIKFDKDKELLPSPQVFDYLPALIPSSHRTGMIGKWHIANQATNGMQHPLDMGYDVFCGVQENIGSLVFWPYVVNGVYQDSSPEEFVTTKQVDDALAFIQKRGNDPWFCYLSLTAPHKPVDVPPEHLHYQEGLSNTSDPLVRYLANVEAVDTELGRLLTSINVDVLLSTVVIVMGDNGTHNDFVNPSHAPGKGSLYEGGINVPLLVFGPGIPAGANEATAEQLIATVERRLSLTHEQVREELRDSYPVSGSTSLSGLVQMNDVGMTIVDICGGQVPADRDGVSMRRYWAGIDCCSPRSMTYLDRFKPNIAPDDDVTTHTLLRRSASDGRFKLIVNEISGETELYDLLLDPEESFPIEDPQGETLQAQLELQAFILSVN